MPGIPEGNHERDDEADTYVFIRTGLLHRSLIKLTSCVLWINVLNPFRELHLRDAITQLKKISWGPCTGICIYKYICMYKYILKRLLKLA